MDITALTSQHLKLVEHEDVQEADFETFLRLEGIKQGILVPPRTEPYGGMLTAYVNRRRWVVDCPYCGEGTVATRRVPFYYCPTCGMFPDWQWWYVKFPPPATILSAEGPLSRRDRKYCNWYPDRETPNDLRQENIDYGLEPD